MKKLLTVILPLTICLVVYQNCGSKSFSSRDSKSTSLSVDDTGSSGGSSTGGSTSGGGTSGGGTSGGIDPNEVTQTKINCDNAQKNGKLLTLNQKITFEDTKIESGRSQVCQFGVGQNLSMQDSFMQARYEQYQKLNLPTNAVICDLNMTTPLQKFAYDDVFVFTFNGRILATNNKTALYQTSPEQNLNLVNTGSVPLYKYDWLALRTKRFQNVADDYCLGQSRGAGSCQWPITEQNGAIQFDFDQQLLIALGLLSSSDQQQFGFMITGDNDPNVDCYHEHLEFNMSVQYYTK